MKNNEDKGQPEETGMIPFREVESKILTLRNVPVIADADVAALYGVETKRVNEAVRNNLSRFPADYMFELTKSELYVLRSKISSTNVSVMNRNSTKTFVESPTCFESTKTTNPCLNRAKTRTKSTKTASLC